MWETQKCEICHKFGVKLHVTGQFLCTCYSDQRDFTLERTKSKNLSKSFTFRDRYCEYLFDLSPEAYEFAKSDNLHFVTLFVENLSKQLRFTHKAYFQDFFLFHKFTSNPDTTVFQLIHHNISRIKAKLVREEHCILRKIEWKNTRVAQPYHERQHQQTIRRNTVSNVLEIQKQIDQQASVISYNIAGNKKKFQQERELRRNLGREPYNRHYGKNLIKTSNVKVLDEQKENLLKPMALSSGQKWIPYQLTKVDAPHGVIGYEKVNGTVYPRIQVFTMQVAPQKNAYWIDSEQSEVANVVTDLFKPTGITILDISVTFKRLKQHNRYKYLAQNEKIDNETYIDITIVNENFMDVVRSAKICEEFEVLFGWSVRLPQRYTFTVSCGTDAATIFAHIFTELDEEIVNSLPTDELELNLLTHFDGIGHPEATYIHLRAFCTEKAVFKNGKKLSSVYPMMAVMDKDIKVKRYVTSQHRELELATRTPYRIDQISKNLLFSRIVYETTDRKILRLRTGGKANHAQAAIHYHVCQ